MSNRYFVHATREPQPHVNIFITSISHRVEEHLLRQRPSRGSTNNSSAKLQFHYLYIQVALVVFAANMSHKGPKVLPISPLLGLGRHQFRSREPSPHPDRGRSKPTTIPYKSASSRGRNINRSPTRVNVGLTLLSSSFL